MAVKLGMLLLLLYLQATSEADDMDACEWCDSTGWRCSRCKAEQATAHPSHLQAPTSTARVVAFPADEAFTDSRTRLSSAAQSQLDKDGYLLLDRVLPDHIVDECRARVDVMSQKDREGGGPGTFFHHMYLYGQVFQDVLQMDELMVAMKALLGEEFTLSSFTTVVRPTNNSGGPLHIDAPLGAMPTPRPSWPMVANSIIYLQDTEVVDGATRAIPGTHQSELMDKPDTKTDGAAYTGVVSIPARKGSILIINGAVWHGAGDNKSSRDRIVLLAFFNRYWMKPQKKHDKVVAQRAPHLVQTMGPTLRKLLNI